LLGIVLLAALREPARGQIDGATPPVCAQRFSFFEGVAGAFRNGYVVLLMAVFAGANFVPVVFLTWLPSFLHDRFHMSLSLWGLNATAYLQTASVLGVLAGGWMADSFARRGHGLRRGGRMLTQALGLLCGVPFLLVTGWTPQVRIILLALTGFGLFKGLYDANIWASLYDVIPVERRGVTTGLMNSVAWLGGGIAPIAIDAGAARFSMGACLSATAAIYLCAGSAMLVAARMRASQKSV
jgi:MFS family permease